MAWTSIEVVEMSAQELALRDAEAEDLCHEMTERLKILHDEKATLSAEIRKLSMESPPSLRLIAADNALAGMAVVGIIGVFMGAAVARFLAAKRKNRASRTKRPQSAPPE